MFPINPPPSPAESRTLEQHLTEIHNSLESIDRTLRGSENEGSPGLLIRTVRLEAKQETIVKAIDEVRREWSSFRRVVMVWALVALFSGAAVGELLSKFVIF